MDSQAHPADVEALNRVAVVEPAWVGMTTGAEALALDKFDVAHCGPPFRSGQQPPRPILNSTIAAAIYEGWVSSADEAEQLIHSSELRWHSAQLLGLALPMAAVATPFNGADGDARSTRSDQEGLLDDQRRGPWRFGGTAIRPFRRPVGRLSAVFEQRGRRVVARRLHIAGAVARYCRPGSNRRR